MAVITTIKLRRGTAAGWTSADPTLAAGEAGYESDTGKLKIGDGATAWTVLAYFAGSMGALDDLSDVVAGSPADGDLLTWDAGTSKWINSSVIDGGAP